MGIRSFVALPVNKDGFVTRFQYLQNTDTNSSFFTSNIAWGLSGKDTLLFGIPYRLSPAGNNRLGDVSVLYRRTLWQHDKKLATTRLALLAGGVIATDSNRENAVQMGLVATFYRDRNGVDVDFLYTKGLDTRIDEGRYDISWQYRFSPKEYPEWGFSTEWYSVIELNGRWREGRSIDHQLTAGLQWVHHNWVLEGAAIQTLNNANDFQFLISTRWHF